MACYLPSESHPGCSYFICVYVSLSLCLFPSLPLPLWAQKSCLFLSCPAVGCSALYLNKQKGMENNVYRTLSQEKIHSNSNPRSRLQQDLGVQRSASEYTVHRTIPNITRVSSRCPYPLAILPALGSLTVMTWVVKQRNPAVHWSTPGIFGKGTPEPSGSWMARLTTHGSRLWLSQGVLSDNFNV